MRPSTLRRLGGILVLLSGACARPPRLPATIPPASGVPRVAYALRMLDLAEGRGAAAEERKCLYVHYTGWLTDGHKFDSSRDTLPNGQPRTPLSFAYGAGAVGAGWDKGGLDGMRVGGRRRLFIPYHLSYGVAGRPPVIPPRADLIFDVELMAVADTLARVDSEPPRRPADFRPRCPAWSALARGS
jgi:peptidylprolyl isomerase